MNAEPTAWRSLGQLLHEQARRFGDRTLFRFEGAQMTFAQVEEQTNRLAHVLKARGIGKGVHVAVMLPNGFEFPLAWLALAKLGAVMVPINTQYQQQDLRYTLNDSEAQLALAGPAQAAILQRAQPACPRLQTIGVLTAPFGEPAPCGERPLREPGSRTLAYGSRTRALAQDRGVFA